MRLLKQKVNVLTMLILLTSCRIREGSTDGLQLVKVDDKYEVELPNSFTKRANLYDEASLQYANNRSEVFVAIIDEDRDETNDILYEVLKDSLANTSKKAFLKSFSLNDYFNICKKGWSDAKMMYPAPKEIKKVMINDRPAFVVETTENVNGNEVYYIVAILETDKAYYQIFTWTLDSKKDKYSQQMKDIINSFDEL
ncbi:hypothetical protein [Capnocytophaga haemolytica]|jgi:hypothetical protein